MAKDFSARQPNQHSIPTIQPIIQSINQSTDQSINQTINSCIHLFVLPCNNTYYLNFHLFVCLFIIKAETPQHSYQTFVCKTWLIFMFLICSNRILVKWIIYQHTPVYIASIYQLSVSQSISHTAAAAGWAANYGRGRGKRKKGHRGRLL